MKDKAKAISHLRSAVENIDLYEILYKKPIEINNLEMILRDRYHAINPQEDAVSYAHSIIEIILGEDKESEQIPYIKVSVSSREKKAEEKSTKKDKKADSEEPAEEEKNIKIVSFDYNAMRDELESNFSIFDQKINFTPEIKFNSDAVDKYKKENKKLKDKIGDFKKQKIDAILRSEISLKDISSTNEELNNERLFFDDYKDNSIPELTKVFKPFYLAGISPEENPITNENKSETDDPDADVISNDLKDTGKILNDQKMVMPDQLNKITEADSGNHFFKRLFNIRRSLENEKPIPENPSLVESYKDNLKKFPESHNNSYSGISAEMELKRLQVLDNLIHSNISNKEKLTIYAGLYFDGDDKKKNLLRLAGQHGIDASTVIFILEDPSKKDYDSVFSCLEQYFSDAEARIKFQAVKDIIRGKWYPVLKQSDGTISSYQLVPTVTLYRLLKVIKDDDYDQASQLIMNEIDRFITDKSQNEIDMDKLFSEIDFIYNFVTKKIEDEDKGRIYQ